jgi:very-short-patch-repair endonuclease
MGGQNRKLAGATVMDHEDRRRRFKLRICRLCSRRFRPGSGRALTCRKCFTATPLCACGCGEKLKPCSYHSLNTSRRYIHGHHVRGTVRSPEVRAKMCKAQKLYADTHKEERLKIARRPERLAKIARSLAKRFSRSNHRPTKCEMVMDSLLESLKVKYESQKVVAGFVPDFLVEKRTIIECDGDYWHSIPAVAKKDKRKDAAYHGAGFHSILHFGESIILNKPRFVKFVIRRELDRW